MDNFSDWITHISKSAWNSPGDVNHSSKGKENWAAVGRDIWMSFFIFVKFCEATWLEAWTKGICFDWRYQSTGLEQWAGSANLTPLLRALNLINENRGFFLNLDIEWWEIIAVCSPSWQTWRFWYDMRKYRILPSNSLGKKNCTSGLKNVFCFMCV